MFRVPRSSDPNPQKKHTQTHSTRLVALTGANNGIGVDLKRSSHHNLSQQQQQQQHKPSTSTIIPNNIPLPMQPTTLIKIEDCSSSSSSTNQHHPSVSSSLHQQQHHHHHQQNIMHPQQLHHRPHHQQPLPPPSIFEQCHSNALHTTSASLSSSSTAASSSASITTSAVQTLSHLHNRIASQNDMTGPTDLSATGLGHVFYQADGNLIQIAPHNGMLDLSLARPSCSPVLTMARCLGTPEQQETDSASGNVEAQPDGKLKYIFIYSIFYQHCRNVEIYIINITFL